MPLTRSTNFAAFATGKPLAQIAGTDTGGNRVLGSETTVSKLRRNIAAGRPLVTMATTPTVTSNTTTQLGSGVAYGYAIIPSRVTQLGATWYLDTAGGRSLPISVDKAGDGLAYSGGSNRSGFSGSWTFMFDGANFELDCQWQSLRILVWNDATNAYEIAYSVAAPGSNFTRAYLNVVFAARATRRIRIEGDYAWINYNLRVASATDTLWPHFPKENLRGIVLGDSFVEGTGATYRQDACWHALGKRLGIEDWTLSGLGGTGVATINGSSTSFLGRYVVDLINRGPFDLVIIEGSGNDYTASSATVTANLGTILDAVAAAMPSALVVCSGAWTNKGSDTVHNPVSTAIQAALVTRPAVKYIDMSDWITGTGRVGATVGDGNADYYVEANTPYIHRSPAGHAYAENRLVNAFAKMLGTA